MMKLFPENAHFDVSDLTIDEMKYMIDMEIEHRKQVEIEIKRREAEGKFKKPTYKY